MFSSVKGTDFIALSITLWLITSSSSRSAEAVGCASAGSKLSALGCFLLLSWSAERGGAAAPKMAHETLSLTDSCSEPLGVCQAQGSCWLQLLTRSLHRPPFKHCLGDNKFLSLVSALGSSALLKAVRSRTDQLSKPLPARNLLPKIAAELWGIFIAATQAFSVLKEWKEDFKVLAWV